MKKFYALMLMVAIAFGAFAQDGAPLYLTGDCAASNWSPTEPLEFTYANGVYTLDVAAVSQFKISTVKGDWSAFDGGAYQAAGKVVSGKTVDLTKGTKNIILGWKGDYTITVAGDLSTITAVTETPDPNEGAFPKLYIRGTFNNWGLDNELETEDGKIYTCAGVNMSQTDEFKIADDNWGEYNFGDIVDLVINTEYEMGENGANCTLAMDLVKATFEFNLEEATLIVHGEGDAPVVEKKLYVVGQNFGNWNRDVNYLMTLVSGEEATKVYTIDLDGLRGEWKIFDGTWKYSFGMGFDEIELDTDVEVYFNSSENFSTDFNFPVKLTLTVPEGAAVEGSSVAALIKVEKTGDAPVVEPLVAPNALYMVGNVNGNNWSTLEGAAVPFVKEGNKFTNASITIDDAGQGFGWFSFITATGASFDEVNNYTRYGAKTNGDYMDDQLPGLIVEYPGGEQAGLCGAWTCAPGTYAAVADFDTCSLEFTLADGVESIEADELTAPAVYYNLQGQRVDNPTSGLYIKKTAKRATKVYIFK